MGHWEFENSGDLTEATVGSALSFASTVSAAPGITAADGAAQVERDAHITVTNPIGGNGGGSRSNQFTIVVDFKVPDFTDGGADNGQFTGLFDLRQTNTDGDYFIRKQNNVPELGVSAVGYVGPGAPGVANATAGTFLGDTWYRLVYAVDSGATGRSTYLNGVKVGNQNNNNTVDFLRGTLGATFGLFQDNTVGEQSLAIVSTIALFDDRLSDEEVALLGLPGDSLVLPTIQNVSWTGALSNEWSEGVLASPKNWVLELDGTTETDFINLSEVVFEDGATTSTVEISNGDVQPGLVSFVNDTSDYVLTGINGIAGPTNLNLDGAGSVRIENANTHTGTTSLTSGGLILANENALQSSALDIDFDYPVTIDGPIAISLGGLTGDGDLPLENLAAAPVALTLNVAADQVHEGEISGAGSILKTGPAAQSLDFENTFTGGVVIAQGSLTAGEVTALGSQPILSTGGTLDFAIESGVETTFPNDISLPPVTGILRMFGSFGPGRVAPSPGTTTRLTGLISGGDAASTFRIGDTNITSEHDNRTILDNSGNTFEGLIQIWRSVVSFTSDGALGDEENNIEINCANFNGGLAFGADVVLNPNRDVTLIQREVINTNGFDGEISGTFAGSAASALALLGGGTLTLSGDTPFAGNVQVTFGTLALTGTSDLALAQSVSLTNAGQLNLNALTSPDFLPNLIGDGSVTGNLTLFNTLSPGFPANSIGTLETDALVLNQGVLAFNIDSSALESDSLLVDGNLSILAGSQLQLTDIAGLPANVPGGTKLALVEYTGAWDGGTLEFFDGTSLVTLADGDTLSVGSNSFVIDYDDPTNGTTAGKFITLTVPGGNAFTTWALAQGLDGTAGREAGFEDDPDGDNLANGLEWVLGGNPLSEDSSAILPSVAGNGATGLTLSFNRASDSVNLANLVVEWNTDLSNNWNEVPIAGVSSGPDENGITVSVENTAIADQVTVAIPASNAAEGRIFARLKAQL